MNVDKPQMIKKNLMLTEQENVDEQKSRGVRIFVSHIFNKINELKVFNDILREYMNLLNSMYYILGSN